MTLRDDSITMRQMLDNAQRAIKHTTNKSVDDVFEDELLGLALVRLVEVIGEAANRVAPETRAKYPQVPWRQAIDTRNRVIHAYDTVDLRVIYEIVRDNLPLLCRRTRTDSEGSDGRLAQHECPIGLPMMVRS